MNVLHRVSVPVLSFRISYTIDGCYWWWCCCYRCTEHIWITRATICGVRATCADVATIRAKDYHNSTQRTQSVWLDSSFQVCFCLPFNIVCVESSRRCLLLVARWIHYSMLSSWSSGGGAVVATVAATVITIRLCVSLYNTLLALAHHFPILDSFLCPTTSSVHRVVLLLLLYHFITQYIAYCHGLHSLQR